MTALPWFCITSKPKCSKQALLDSRVMQNQGQR
jgi:hypothetical protein